MLEFLPEKVYFPEEFDFEEMVEILYSIFERDIKLGELKYKKLPVIFDNRKIDSNYEEGFWHLIERGKADRNLDIRRAKRLPWVKPLVENSDDLRLFKWVENQMGRRGSLEEVTYIFFNEGNYLVVLKNRKNRYFLATAFYVVGFHRNRYMNRYLNAQKKGPGC